MVRFCWMSELRGRELRVRAAGWFQGRETASVGLSRAVREHDFLVKEFPDAVEERVAQRTIAATNARMHFAAAQQQLGRDLLVQRDIVAARLIDEHGLIAIVDFVREDLFDLAGKTARLVLLLDAQGFQFDKQTLRRAVRGQVIMADVYPLALDFRAPPEGVWMPAGQTTSLRVPLLMPVALGITLLQQAFANPTIAYRFIGKADVTGTRTFQVEKDDYSVDERGTITRDQIAAILPNSLAPPPH